MKSYHLKPKLTIPKDDVLYVTKKWLTNGHWILDVDYIRHHKLKPFINYVDKMHGRYNFGMWESDTIPDIERILPKLAGYEDLTVVGATVNPAGVIESINYVSVDREVKINPFYSTLLHLPNTKAKAHKTKNNSTIAIVALANEAIIGCVMPLRGDK